jgi:DNA-binding transcriptional regulator YhcF (GntR family)
MAAYYWIKLYDEILDDPKMGRLSDGAFRLCINLFLLAGRSEERDGRLPDFGDIAWTLRLSGEDMNKHWAELERAGIVYVKDDIPNVANFDKRQSAVTDAERMRQYRERKRQEQQEANAPESQGGNEPVTDGKRSSYDAVTESNTDIDIDIEKKKRKEKYIPAHAHDVPDQIHELITAISTVVKTACVVGVSDGDFEAAAYTLIGWGVELPQVGGFSQWWEVNGYYTGKPALKSFLDEFQNYRAGVKLDRTNGRSSPAPAELSEAMLIPHIGKGW